MCGPPSFDVWRTRHVAEFDSKPTAVFLDRDGTIAEEVGYANHLSRFEVFPFAPAAIGRLNRAKVPVIVVTNQSGVARGFFPESLIHEIHKKMKIQLAAGGARVDAIYYCPHIREHNCRCRKPLPGMLEQAAKELNLDLKGSVLISDRHADIEMVQSVGGRGILVLTGYGRGEYEWNRNKWLRMPDNVLEDLTAAVDMVLSDKS
jgi:D-glycero-D-manno-heptose 1,7-bisphosphate phosphatase